MAMKEPSLRTLAEKDRKATAYRFLWLPAFHDPISVRFVVSEEGAVLHAVRLELNDNYDPRSITARRTVKRTVTLKPAHWRRIADQLEKARFWALPTWHDPWGDNIVDGDILIVEGVTDGRYHMVRRHSPRGGDFVDLCRAMLFMSGIDVRTLWYEYR